ncbi:hypothetical protein KZZ07_08175 [Mameliella sp. CS4]|uniref:hypothetical protein n=1 Tax=Mameliella sp. CS4 TaxID=2862329 RepID=UPI001C6027CE|nr:hypothetical protein [Mameliella sp. CS4]MBW4982514.1 hypothetical protein [Mameliella sp. CS4]
MFDGLRKLSAVIEIIGWLTVAGGMVLIALNVGERDPLPGIMAAVPSVVGGLLLVLLAHLARAVAFIAETVDAERRAVPAPGGGKAPGRIVEVRYGRELRDIGDGRYWVEGQVFDNMTSARKVFSGQRDLYS